VTIDRQKIAEAAQRFASKGQYDSAIAEYQRLVALEPGDVRTLLKIGDLQVRAGATQQAIETYLHAGELYEQQGLHQKAIAVYKQVLQLNPDQLALYGRVADLHIKLGLTSDALQAMELLAQRHARTGDQEALANTYRQILLLDGQNLPTRIRLGELLSKMGRGEEAATEFEAACKVLESNHRIDEWAKVAERLVFHRPNHLDVQRRLASYYLERNDARRALPKIQACYKIDPRDVSTLDLLAQAFRALNQLPKTISVLKEVARIHGAAGRSRERNEVYQRVLELNPTDQEARDALRAGSAPGSKRPQSVPPAAIAPAPGPSASARSVSSVPATEIVEEVLDDAVEEVPESTAPRQPPEAPREVVFSLTPRPARVEAQPQAPEAPRPTRTEAQPQAPEAPRPTRTEAQPQAPEAPRPTRTEAQPQAPEAHRAMPTASMRPSASLRTPFVPHPPIAPPSERSPGEAGRLLGEAEIFLKYGLRSKAMAHMARALELEPDAPEVIARVRDFYAALNDGNGVFRLTLRLAELLAEHDPSTAYQEVSRALELDPEHAAARALYERLHALQVQASTEAQNPVEEGVLIDESDVDVRDEAPAPPESYFDPGFPQYDDAPSDATEIGASPLNLYDPGADTAGNYRVEEIPVVVESDQTVRAASLFPGGRREIEEGLDEAEFFVTQGLYDDARMVLQDLLQMHPNHPLVLERLDEVEQLVQMHAVGYEGSDPSYGLADKIAEEVEHLHAYDGSSTGQIDVETVLAQFKQGVGRTVSIEDCDTHYDLGIAYKEMGLLDDAIAEFKIATMNPARQCIGETMIGLSYMEKGDIPSAIEHFKLGLQAPQRTEREELGLYYEMGAAYEIVGDLHEALYYFQKVDKRDPSFRNVRQRVQRLQGALHGVSEGFRSPAREEIDRQFDDLLKE
jgi:tetratricopeptide (TPR) repeat protein